MRHNGGPAFPTPWHNDGDMNNSAPDGAVIPPGGIHHLSGMSLRDWFAGQALAGYLSDPDIVTTGEAVKAIAKAMYRVADAMLEERAK